MNYTIKEIKQNTDIINDLSLDVYDIFADLIKMLKYHQFKNKELETKLLEFKLNPNSSRVRKNLEEFSILFAYLLFSEGKYTKELPEKAAKVSKEVKESKSLEDFIAKVYETYGPRVNMEAIGTLFHLFKLDGTSKDLIALLEFNLFDQKTLELLDKMTFIFHPFNGCDAPL
ncbi:hypothetical protein [Mycoplasmopsis alligatoris]|uniref:Uncharacterized protein n=1 Tax=Mycoplasmopsis alligatoris A21JP2 TaxID=747682 RepID=D4XVF7_9BACT|nr:hypothetical protein [Mycoplasmopsis alligatoris]EFF41654.1 hypothetical protein MALL_0625 [Mycoplasmopsis alligatoris A21JP2]